MEISLAIKLGVIIKRP